MLTRIRRVLQFQRVLNLDDPTANDESLEIRSPEVGPSGRRMARKFIQVFLRKTLDTRGIAFNVFHVVMPHAREARIYFTDYRPTMRTKQLGRGGAE